MKDDFLKALGPLGLIARLKRLSDSMRYSVKDLYRSKRIDIEPNWHLVFLILKQHKTRTMTEIAESFRLSQPAIVKIIHKMKKKGYVEIADDANDQRKRQLRLSQRALDELPLFEKIWSAGRESIMEMLEENETFLESLEKLEHRIEEKNFRDRAIDRLG